ncbi:MAG: hypothetical protein WCB79_09085 [Halobacteriota archaeon]
MSDLDSSEGIIPTGEAQKASVITSSGSRRCVPPFAFTILIT